MAQRPSARQLVVSIPEFSGNHTRKLEGCATLKRIGITLGDPAGIGPEVVRAALTSGRLPTSAEYIVIGKFADWSLGKPTHETAQAAAAALEEAVSLAQNKAIDAVVTGPIHKARMYEIGFKFPGPDGIFRAALRREEFRHAAHRRKNHRCPCHQSLAVGGSARSAEEGRDRARWFVAARISLRAEGSSRHELPSPD